MKRQEIFIKIRDCLIPWYKTNQRNLPWRETNSPYSVWISEIMLQQTRIETVIPYYYRFMKEIPDIATLANVETEKLMKLWEGMGYYSRAKNLQKAAKTIMETYEGVFPNQYEKVLSLSGIGEYTAGAICSICYNQPTPAVDGNVLRVLSRLTEDEREINSSKTKKEVTEELKQIYPEQDAGVFTQALMELGETICLPNAKPDCQNCPCHAFCICKEDKWELYPKKAMKKERRKEDKTVFVLFCDNRLAILKRPKKGLLSDMWELPNVKGHLEKADIQKQCDSWKLNPVEIEYWKNRNHIFSHVEWNMSCYRITVKKENDLFVWVNKEQLEKEISLPTAFRKLLSEE